MQRELLKILGLAAGGLILNKILTEVEENYNDMANTHNHFLKFEQNISLTPTKKAKLIASRRALQERIVNYFRLYTKLPVPKFYIQGSYKMNTMVLANDGTYDVDLGIYFLANPYVTSFTVQDYV
ncbi:MAG: cyclic GMP-AMP synthase DncV-like nucleotidyltransferase, partial [Flavobacterium sp.]|uniref:cyclic GMP-AMP synthase DncV-like nucleotidyltransferase n=1 Tax=Flavobacterium sp. TaxID=239 RepID=UPI00326617C5